MSCAWGHGWHTADTQKMLFLWAELLVLVLWILGQIILYCGCCLCRRKMNSTLASTHCRSVESSVGHNLQHCRFCRFLQNQPLVNHWVDWYMWTSAIEGTWQIHGWIPQPIFFVQVSINEYVKEHTKQKTALKGTFPIFSGISTTFLRSRNSIFVFTAHSHQRFEGALHLHMVTQVSPTAVTYFLTWSGFWDPSLDNLLVSLHTCKAYNLAL